MTLPVTVATSAFTAAAGLPHRELFVQQLAQPFHPPTVGEFQPVLHDVPPVVTIDGGPVPSRVTTTSTPEAAAPSKRADPATGTAMITTASNATHACLMGA